MVRKKCYRNVSTHNEGESVVAERSIRTLKNKIFKHMTSVSENVYIDKLDDIVNIYNNAYDSAIRMKPSDENSSTYIDSSKESNDINPKSKIGDIFRISNIKTLLQKLCSKLI